MFDKTKDKSDQKNSSEGKEFASSLLFMNGDERVVLPTGIL